MTTSATTTATSRDHFSNLVKQWSHFGPPLRPSPDDTAVVQRVISNLPPAPRVAVLGLTPEIIGCDWPAGTHLSAVDHSPAMFRALWPPAGGPPDAQAVLADWCAMPFPDRSLDLVAGDGCFIALTYPDGFEALMHEVHRVLRPSGQFIIRVFLRPERAESVDDIAHAMSAGQIGSVHALKLRLLAALHGPIESGVSLDNVCSAWKSLPAVPSTLAGRRGWTPDEIVGIESYSGLSTRYSLPTLEEFRASVTSHFIESERSHGRHELSDHCPTFVLTPV